MGNAVDTNALLKEWELPASSFPSKEGGKVKLQDGRCLGYMVYGKQLESVDEGENDKDNNKDNDNKGDSAVDEDQEAGNNKKEKHRHGKEKKSVEEEEESEKGDRGKEVRNIILFHGCPGSRFFFPAGDVPTLIKTNTRVVVLERPGFGLSDPQPNRSTSCHSLVFSSNTI